MIAGLSGRVAALVASAVVLAVLLLGWLVLVSPQRSKAEELSGQIGGTQSKIASTQAYVSSPETRRSIQDLKRLRKTLPDDPRVSQILRQLTAAAGAAQVSITSITPQAVTPTAGGQALPIALSVDGHYFGISKFMHLLRSQVVVRGTTVRGSGRLYSIDGIQFSGGGAATPASPGSSGGGSDGTINANITLNAFFFGTTNAVAPAPVTSTTADTATTP